MTSQATNPTSPSPSDPSKRAVAYYRSSLADAEATIDGQRQQAHEWAEKHGLEIIREFVDADTSGLETESRPGFDGLMEWVKNSCDFQYIVCLDASRWGRFPGLDLSAQYTAECHEHGRQVIYTQIADTPDPDRLRPVYLQFERFRAAPCCTLGGRIRRGLRRAAEQGYWTGGNPPYGLRRLLLNGEGNALQLLKPGQRRTTRKHRVALVLGEPGQVAAVRRIFCAFVDLGHTTSRIADGLNAKRIASPRGNGWTARHVLACLRNKAYTAPVVYRQRRGREWVRTSEAGKGVVSLEQFERAQARLGE